MGGGGLEYSVRVGLMKGLVGGVGILNWGEWVKGGRNSGGGLLG